MLEHDFPSVRLIKNRSRHGFGTNQNTAIQACGGKVYFVLNDDTIVHQGAIDTLCLFLENHPSVACVGPRLKNTDGSLQISCYKFPSPLRCVFENLLLTALFPNHPVIGDYRAWEHNRVREVDFVTGAAMMVRRSVIDQVGLFDDNTFFMYAEETDWQKRMTTEGWTIALCPDAVVTHSGGGSSASVPDRQFCEFQRSSAKFIGKHFASFRIMGAANLYDRRINSQACLVVGSLPGGAGKTRASRSTD